MLVYDLWDTGTGNLISSFGDEGAALDSAATMVRDYGPSGVATAALVRFDDDEEDGDITRLTAGNELLARVRQLA